MIKKKKNDNEFVIALELKGDKKGGLSVDEFVKMTEIAKLRHGDGVMIGQPDKNGQMHLSKDKKHIGYVDVNTGSLVWDPVEQAGGSGERSKRLL